ncbi:hypothetical protein GGU10DRAFT_418514 [Lentinula aff. detonsa]|uniref:Uncharacterized protein n=1 Tax=Lentinula aff. detonsa TaxID=2804958 RepID=A0AA38NIP6_9AGAR|nr:hypothetical protein GGU10DRAFT_418514 [Lentinula aff. detonsa]
MSDVLETRMNFRQHGALVEYNSKLSYRPTTLIVTLAASEGSVKFLNMTQHLAQKVEHSCIAVSMMLQFVLTASTNPKRPPEAPAEPRPPKGVQSTLRFGPKVFYVAQGDDDSPTKVRYDRTRPRKSEAKGKRQNLPQKYANSGEVWRELPGAYPKPRKYGIEESLFKGDNESDNGIGTLMTHTLVFFSTTSMRTTRRGSVLLYRDNSLDLVHNITAHFAKWLPVSNTSIAVSSQPGFFYML